MNTNEPKEKSRATPAAACLAVALLVLLFHLPFTRDAILFDDAADYMRAASTPIAQTWLNTNSVSPRGMLALRQQQPEFRHHPWDYLYAASDNAALRHFHGPVSFYALHLVASQQHGTARLLISLAAAAACGVLTLLLIQSGCPILLAALLGLFAGLDNRFVETSIDPSPHAFYILFTLLFLLFFSRALRSASIASLYLSAATLALCVATLEFSVVLVASAVVTLAFLRFIAKQPLPTWTRSILLRALGIFLATSFILWPGGWLRGGYLESYGVLSATVLFHNKTAFGERLTAGLLYRTLFEHHLVLVLLTLVWIAGVVTLALRRLFPVTVVVSSIYALFAFALGVADHFRLNTYVSEFTLFLVLATGITLAALLDALPPSTQRAIKAIACALLLLGASTEYNQRFAQWRTRPWLQNDFAAIRARVPVGEALLTSHDREALSLYLPAYRFEPTLSAASSTPRSDLRTKNIRYDLFDAALPPPADATILATIRTALRHADLLWKKP